MKLLKKIFLLCFLLITILSSLVVNATDFNISSDLNTLEAESNEPDVKSNAAILIDAKFGKILFEKNSKERLFPASTTKVMTAILTVENCNLQDKVKISHYAVNSVPATYSVGFIKPGQVFTVEQLLNLTLIYSANDAAYALAEYIVNKNSSNHLLDSSNEAKAEFESSITKFSEMMNQKAKELGTLDTNFVNPNGIHNEAHYSTAYDLALIGKYAYSNSIITSICAKASYSLPENAVNNFTEYKTTNPLLRSESKYYYKYATGMKTGYTDPAKSCIIATAQKDDSHLIAVILGGEKLEDGTSTRESDCIKLFDYGFNNYKASTLIKNGDIFKTITIINGTKETSTLDLICASTLTCLTKSENVLDITPKISFKNTFAPISKGQVIATITYTIDGIDYSTDLMASHDVYSSSTMNFILLLGILFILLLVIVICMTRKSKKK